MSARRVLEEGCRSTWHRKDAVSRPGRNKVGTIGRPIHTITGPLTSSCVNDWDFRLLETDKIDELLARYTAAEARIAANLLELDEHPTFKILAGGGLRGATLAKVGSAMERSPDLWRWLSQLQRVLADARDIRDDGRMNSERRARITELLTGRSILLHVDERSLAQRGLLDAGQTNVRSTIEHLLAQMREAYEPIRDGVAAVDQVWTEVVPRTDSGATTLQRLQAEADRLGLREPTLSVLDRRLSEVRSALAEDPLSLSGTFAADLETLVGDATRQMASIARGYDELDGDIAATETQLAELRVLRNRAAAAHTQSSTKIKRADNLVHTPDVAIIDGAGGLASLADAIRADASSNWQQKRQQLDAWMAKTIALREQLTRAYDLNVAPLRKRDELRGLLAAYWAKAAALGRAEEASLSDLHDDAHNELFTSPTDLDRASMLVGTFGTALRVRGADTSPPASASQNSASQNSASENSASGDL